MAMRVPGLRSRRNGDPYGFGLLSGVLKVGLQSGHRDLGTQRGRRHQNIDHNFKIVTFAAEYFVRCDLEFDVRSPAGPPPGPTSPWEER